VRPAAARTSRSSTKRWAPLGPCGQAAQGLAQLGIALAARLEHDEVAAQERDRLAELMRRLCA
jgi:hypothetical protein